MTESGPRITVFGLGEAGSAIACDLAAAGAEVRGFDPAGVPTPVGVRRHAEPRDAVKGATLVMGITAAADAREAMSQAWSDIDPTATYANLATSPPALERELADIAANRGVPYADVALMAPVPGRGLGTPALASGTGAVRFATIVNPLGGDVVTLGETAGQAAARKLMRSIVTKGLTALVIESMESAAVHGDAEWLWGHLVETLADADATLLTRLLEGTRLHAARRLDEMRAVEAFLDDLGVTPHMTRGTANQLDRLVREGMPDIVLDANRTGASNGEEHR